MDFLHDALEDLRRRGLYRQLRTIESFQGPMVWMGGRQVVCLCSNNYLGLASEPELIETARQALDRRGLGAGASRLVSGDMTPHRKFEERAAAFLDAEAALMMGSGYLANVGAIDALTGRGDVIFSDKLNHASLIDGCRLSRAETRVFPHLDYDTLDRMLREAPRETRKLIVTDSVFSMDGDLADLPLLVELKRTHGAQLYLDEAHAIGVLGQRGAGAAERFGLTQQIEVRMATLGKAVGVYGAFLAGSRELIDYLVNTCRTFIYSTALPPVIASVATEVLEWIESQGARRDQLLENKRFFTAGLEEQGWNVKKSISAIVPVLIGDAEKTMALSNALLEEGVLAVGIRPPTVPPGTSRIRCAVMATHARSHLEQALGAFAKCGRALGLIGG